MVTKYPRENTRVLSHEILSVPTQRAREIFSLAKWTACRPAGLHPDVAITIFLVTYSSDLTEGASKFQDAILCASKPYFFQGCRCKGVSVHRPECSALNQLCSVALPLVSIKPCANGGHDHSVCEREIHACQKVGTQL